MSFNKSFEKFQKTTLADTKNVFGGKDNCEDVKLTSSCSNSFNGQTSESRDWSDGVVQAWPDPTGIA